MLKSVKDVKDAPNELRQLSKELDDIERLARLVAKSQQAILGQIEADTADIKPGQAVARDDDHLRALEPLIKDIATTVFELDKQVSKCLNSKGEFSRFSGSMFKWVGWRKARVAELLRMAKDLHFKINTTQGSIVMIEQYAALLARLGVPRAVANNSKGTTTRGRQTNQACFAALVGPD